MFSYSMSESPYPTDFYPYIGQPFQPYWRYPVSIPLYPQFRDPRCISKAEVELNNLMRSLWEQHVAWTRMTIISLVFKLPDVDAVTARLLQNAPDMGHSLRPFYGADAAQAYNELIKEHLVIAADLVKAAVEGNKRQVAANEKKWYANADEIAEFLASVNPYLPKEEFRNMLYEHLALTKQEAVAMIHKDYKTSIQLYDKIEAEALQMADALTEAIVKQFPERFR
ncbi:acetylglutamate kinase [Paenibacillus thalictri]|uniref:Acetylglutamate kinase n=2 Tax=Paenibacillus thalictri TaxID=2527873 RepID=A0A4Q9DYB9_9BACL|nr:acetylglutamate kinase [Paenibacillus thalictri]TBL81396.1 acetylglutamate kinase [Paenibacillus thalictri]